MHGITCWHVQVPGCPQVQVAMFEVTVIRLKEQCQGLSTLF